MFDNCILQKAVDNANNCLKKIYSNYVEPNILHFRFTKARSYWANISRIPNQIINSDNEYLIKIGSLFACIKDQESRIRRLEECIIHEFIHTIPGCFNHGHKFKKIASAINLRFPKYNIQTRTAAEDFGIVISEPIKRYAITCKHCGKVFYYSRKPKYDLSKYYCNHCGFDTFELTTVI